MEASTGTPLYPLRNAEFLVEYEEALTNLFTEVEPLTLSPEARERVFGFSETEEGKGYEQKWHERLREAQAISAGRHSLFVDYLVTAEGWDAAQNVYGKVDPRIKGHSRPDSSEEARRFFYEIENLGDLELKERRDFYEESKEWARGRFLAQVVSGGGTVGELEDPCRMTRVFEPEKLATRARRFRELKTDLRKEEERLSGETGEEAEAKRIVCRLYRQYVNVQLAGLYKEAAVVAQQGGVMEETRREVLEAVRGRGLSEEAKRDGLSPEYASRVLARINRFLEGTGAEVEGGYFRAIPRRLEAMIEERRQGFMTASPEYNLFNQYRPTTEQLELLTTLVLDRSGFTGWEVEVVPRRVNFSVAYRDASGQIVRKVYVPGNYSKGLARTMEILAHEVEAHVGRHVGREALALRLTQEYSTGRSGGISEAGGVLAEEMVRGEFGAERAFLGVYYAGLRAKEAGGKL